MTDRKISLALFLAGAVALSLCARAQAISITPTVQSFELKPGESLETEVTVASTEDEVVTVIPTSKDWFVLPANQGIKIKEWLKIKADKFVLNPGESKKMTATVTAPRKAQGELVGMLSFRTTTPSRASVEFVMSAAVYLAIKGTEKLKGEVVAFTVKPSSDSVTAGVLVRNIGNVHIRPYGILQIINDKKRPMVNLELERGQPTYPGNMRTYMATVKDFHLKPGRYIAQIDLQDGDRNVLIDSRREEFTYMEDGKIRF